MLLFIFHYNNIKKHVKIASLLGAFFITGCDKYPVTSKIQYGVAGKAGQHTAVSRDSEGNPFGYYEYLPKSFVDDKKNQYPVIFYWNGKNAISGNGREELPGLLKQGLPKNIDDGKHYNVIVISAQLYRRDWKTLDVDPFVTYILERYKNIIDSDRVYMSGFSAGGGVTIKYALAHAEKLAAIVPIAPAIRQPDEQDINSVLNNIGVWFFHNRDDDVINVNRSILWHKILSKNYDNNKLTVYEVEGHYAWQQAYASAELWDWLLAKKRRKDN